MNIELNKEQIINNIILKEIYKWDTEKSGKKNWNYELHK